MKRVLIALFYYLTLFTVNGQTWKDEYNTCAVERFNVKDYSGAIDYFTRIIELDPNDSIAYFDRAMIKDAWRD